MSNYKEEAITGSKWVRSNKVSITNPYQGIPEVHFGEEEITLLSDGKTLNSNLPGITIPFVDPSKIFPLLNPVTGEELGVNSTYQEVYVILHSLYIALAKERDNQGV